MHYSLHVIIRIILLLTTGLSACRKDVSPACIQGTVIGYECDGSVLIQINSREEIGVTINYLGKLGENLNDEYTNVVSTFSGLSGLGQPDQQLFFTYRIPTNEEIVYQICNTMVIRYAAPQIIITSVSATDCPQGH